MKATPLELLNDFPKKTILVLGDAILDSYLEGSSTRLCREAPVPIVDINRESRYPGGAANTAVSVAAMGATCLLFSVIGKDAAGDDLRQRLSTHGVNIFNLLSVPERETLFKQRVVANNQIIARVDKGSTHAIEAVEANRLASLLEAYYKTESLDGVIISDYGYGTITPSTLAKLRELSALFKYPLIIDAKDLTKYNKLNEFKATAMTPNYAEAMAILGQPVLPIGEERKKQVLAKGQFLLNLVNSKIVIVTLDQDGAVVFERGTSPCHVPTTPQKGTVGGAGDTFIAAFALALCAGATPEVATQIGVQAATTAVSLPGTATCTLEDLRRSLQTKPETISSRTTGSLCMYIYKVNALSKEGFNIFAIDKSLKAAFNLLNSIINVLLCFM
jgi:D-beta-D-heptose 7-phosphate kinase/D-beta-D-heptose 1-phosphate adenosyltransferase